MLRTACILEMPKANDGIRISVMSRHTMLDGVTPDPRITPNLFFAHQLLLAPSPKLVGDYYKRGLGWEEFAQRYLEEIREGEKSEMVGRLIESALQGTVTILCIEPTPKFCHRRLLAEECLRHEPRLRLSIR